MNPQGTLRCLQLAPLLAAGWIGTAAAEPIRNAANTSWSMPFAKFDGERLTGGVIFDITQGLADALNRPIIHVPLPRKRVEGAALAGELDLRCYVNPKWTDAPNAFVWTEPLFELSDVIFGSDGVPAPRTIADIAPGSVVSAVLGYRYPALETTFASGQLKREDTIDQDKVLLKLTAGRTPYGISNSVTLDWYLRSTPRHALANWRVQIGSAAIYCAVPKASPIAAGPLIEALNAMKKSGRIDAILRSYR